MFEKDGSGNYCKTIYPYVNDIECVQVVLVTK